MLGIGKSKPPVRWSEEQKLSCKHSAKDCFVYMSGLEVFQAQLKHKRAVSEFDDAKNFDMTDRQYRRLKHQFEKTGSPDETSAH